MPWLVLYSAVRSALPPATVSSLLQGEQSFASQLPLQTGLSVDDSLSADRRLELLIDTRGSRKRVAASKVPSRQERADLEVNATEIRNKRLSGWFLVCNQ